MTCIYCGSAGPFTDEHVIPAGVGGDDKAWLLKGLVCGTCNTQVFSKLETKFMRASPVAIARLFLQSRTRLRGSRATRPTIQSAASYFDDPEMHLLLEQEFSGGEPIVLPQVVLQPPDKLAITARDVEAAKALVAELGTLGETSSIVEKRREGIEIRFSETMLDWIDDHYEPRQSVSRSTPPKDAIWLEPLTRPATPTTSLLPPRHSHCLFVKRRLVWLP
jgi:hypothetical protein